MQCFHYIGQAADGIPLFTKRWVDDGTRVVNESTGEPLVEAAHQRCLMGFANPVVGGGAASPSATIPDETVTAKGGKKKFFDFDEF